MSMKLRKFFILLENAKKKNNNTTKWQFDDYILQANLYVKLQS